MKKYYKTYFTTVKFEDKYRFHILKDVLKPASEDGTQEYQCKSLQY